MKTKSLCILFLLLSFNIAIAQDGPLVPCVGCDSLTQAPYPETGLWHNPEQSPGTGFNFEIQNGVLAGFVYSYAADGKPEWELVSGELVRSEKEGVLWELETTLSRADGGSCIGCEFNPPEITEGATIHLEFMQRNYLRISIGGVFDQFFVPFIYGSVAKAYFGDKTPYQLPEFMGEVFVMVVKPKVNDETSWNTFLAKQEKTIVSVDSGVKTVRYNLSTLLTPLITPPIPPLVIITCTIDEKTSDPVCRVENGEDIYSMPIANMNEHRFTAEAEDGSTIEGIRLDYD